MRRRAGVDHDARRRNERGARYRRGVQLAAQIRRLRAARVRRSGHSVHARGGLGPGTALSRRRCSARRTARTALPLRMAEMLRRPPTASGRLSISRPPSGCRSCSSSRTMATAFRCRRGSRRRAATSRAISQGFRGLRVLEGDASDPMAAARAHRDAVTGVRSGGGPALIRLLVPRLSGHSGQDTQTYKSAAEIAAERDRDPLAKLRAQLVPDLVSASDWDLEIAQGRRAVARSAGRPSSGARAPDPEARSTLSIFGIAQPTAPSTCSSRAESVATASCRRRARRTRARKVRASIW